MEKNDARTTGYRLAARLRGDRLTIEAPLRETLERDFADRIGAIRRSRRDGDRRALEESLEWERLGDFRLATGSPTAALRAYGAAAFSCCKGDHYDCGVRPLRSLQRRYLILREKMAALCGDDERLRALIPPAER